MRERPEADASQPLPLHWLPEPQAPEGEPLWDARTRQIMAEAVPELRRLGSRPAAAGMGWWVAMAFWWRPAAALAAASAVLLVLIDRAGPSLEPPPGSVPLGLVASEGDPVALWAALGVQADPVLAWIAVQDPGGPSGPDVSPTPREEENR